MTKLRSKAFWGIGTPCLEYSPLPGRIDPPRPVQLSGNVTLLHLRPDEQKAIPSVKIGTAVKTGQKLSLYGNGDYVSSPVTGTVSALNSFAGSFGRNFTAISILPAAEEIFDEALQGVYQTPTLASALDFLAAAPGYPGLQRLADPDRPIKTLVVCGLDQDLLVLTQQYVLATRSHDVQVGLRLLQQITGIEEVVILTRREAIQGYGHGIGRVLGVESSYPSALPQLVMARLFGSVVPTGRTCEDMGFCFMSAEAVASIGVAFSTGRIPVTKLFTVISKDGTPHLSEARIGTPLGDVLKRFGYAMSEGDRLVLGGPMRGAAVYSADHPVLPDTDAVMILGSDQAVSISRYPCINCGECVRVCPARIQVNLLIRYLETGKFADAEESYDLGSCVECGLCSYVCVSMIPILQYITLAKYELARSRQTEEANA